MDSSTVIFLKLFPQIQFRRDLVLEIGGVLLQHSNVPSSFCKGSSTDEDFDSSVGLLEDCRPCKTESSQPYQTLPEHSDGVRLLLQNTSKINRA